jgi:PDZ domain-containing protein
VAAAIIVVSVLNISVPYYALTPGPAQDVTRLIAIDGAKTTPVSGQLLLTTVSLHDIRVAEAVRGWFDPSIAILSRSAIIPPGESVKEVEERTTEQMDESQVLAAAAALSILGYKVKVEPTGARIRDVAVDVPASKTLHRGDVIVGADGMPVRSADQLGGVVRRHKPGDEIQLKIVRGSHTIDVRAKTIGRPENPAAPIIGITLETIPRVRLPLAIRIDSLGIGGPSAGLMFALGIFDLLDPGDLARGRIIAGTGEIGLDGDVAPVGGVRQKIESARRVGAQLFIVPFGELDQACAVAKGMPVVGVDNLREAIRVLRGTPGTAVRSCP